jgi:hypothetical protein
MVQSALRFSVGILDVKGEHLSAKKAEITTYLNRTELFGVELMPQAGGMSLLCSVPVLSGTCRLAVDHRSQYPEPEASSGWSPPVYQVCQEI